MAQKNFKRLLLRIRGSNSFQLSRMSVRKWIGYFYPKDSDDREGEKKEKYSNRHPSTFMGGLPQGWVFFTLILLSTAATWEPGVPGSGWRFPGRLRHDGLLEIESPGRSRHVDLLGLLDWQIPEQVEAWHFEDQTLDRSRQVGLLGPLSWELGNPKVSSVTSTG